MPAVSETPANATPTLPLRFRPRGPRYVGITLLLVVYGLCAFAWLSWDAQTRAEWTGFQMGTIVFIGVLMFACVYALIRSRVDATAEGLTVVNGFKRHHYEWAQIVAIHFGSGAPWPTIDINDGSTMSLLAIQASDGGYARRAVRQLRTLLP